MWHDRFHPTTAQWGQKQTSNNPVEYASIYFVGSGVYGCGKCETIHLNIKAYILQTAVYMGAASVNQCSWISAVESVQTAVYMAVALVKQSTWILKRVFCRQRCIWQWQVWNNPLEYKSVYFADSGVHDSGTCETIQLNIKACILQTAVYMTVARVKPIQLNIKAYIHVWNNPVEWILKRIFCRQRCIWERQVWINAVEDASTHFRDSGVYASGKCGWMQSNMQAHHTFYRQWCIWQRQVWHNPVEDACTQFADSDVYASGKCDARKME